MVPTVGWKIQIYIVRAFKLEKVFRLFIIIWLSNYFGFESSTIGVTSGAGTAYPSGAPEFISGF
jgi:hypothetical protein